jgi:hypothetical protein
VDVHGMSLGGLKRLACGEDVFASSCSDVVLFIAGDGSLECGRAQCVQCCVVGQLWPVEGHLFVLSYKLDDILRVIVLL